MRSTDKVKLSLPPERPRFGSRRVDRHVFLESHADALTAPLWNGRCGLKLDREPHGRNHRNVPATWHALLIIPQADERSGAMAMHSDRMRVHRSIDSRGAHADE